MTEPTEKALGMTELLEAMAGRSTAIRAGRCAKKPIGCERLVEFEVRFNVAPFSEWYEDPDHHMPFRDARSMTEYRISGLCQKCQDEVFGFAGSIADLDDDEDDPSSVWREPEAEGDHIGTMFLGETQEKEERRP